MVSNFDFVRAGWPEIAVEARKAEGYANGDPRSSLFYARRAAELIVNWMYAAEATLQRPYKDDFAALTYEPTFKNLVGPGIMAKLDVIRRQGNNAVHRAAPLRPTDSLPVVRELFHVLIWVATNYARTPAERPVSGAPFNATLVPTPQAGAAAQSMVQLQKLAADAATRDAALADARAQNANLETELALLRAEVALAKAANATVVDTHDYREDETRSLFIDLLLREAGWALTDKRDIEFPVTGMPNNSEGGKGFVDYVLWGEDGMPLGLVEAKRTREDANIGQQQARLYADALERQFGQRPIIFYSNGYDHWIWDDSNYPPRQVQGFYTRDQLALLIQRRSTRKALGTLLVSESIAGRHYQQRAVRKVAESFEAKERRALLVMATGSGKTRTVIALSDLLIRANWAKRILFLADRVALVNQATNAFKAQLPDAAPVNLVTEKDTDGRVYLSTYPTMMGLIDSGGDDLRRFGPGYFDLIVVDEAHRSVYQKYGAIFDYFDSLVVGLTATPKDEVDHNTYGLFGLEDGVPTDSYDLADAIAEGYLVPPVGRAVSTQFLRQGIKYADLSESEKEQWDLAEWHDDLVPEEVAADDVNRWLFNADTVDKVLQTLMTEGRRVAGGDTLGKTIIFARSKKHADFIQKRFDLAYPEFAGHYARVIVHGVTYAQSLIDEFSAPASQPQIAISVDMLDTGIDIPDVVNLVFFKPVHSKTKYWQMVGRGTRLREDLYGPGVDKADFVIFDVCQNIEYFNADVAPDGSSQSESLTSRLFTARLALVAGLQADADDTEHAALREGVASGLHARVAGMSRDNFLVRAKLRNVERFSEAARWLAISSDDVAMATELAGLPSAVDVLDTDEQAKRFDLFAVRAQLGVLVGDPGFVSAKKRMQAIANALAEQKTIPVIAQNIELIAAVAGNDWWDDVTVGMLEMARVRLRGLVGLIDSRDRAVIYTNFVDVAGESLDVALTITATAVDRQRFTEKAYAFLQEHADDAVLFKVRTGKQLTALDLTELERILVESGGFAATDVHRVAEEAHGLGLFVRTMLGLDRAAATEELSAFTAGTTFTGNQLDFVNLLVEQLTARGAVDPALLFQAPFTDLAPTGPEALFGGAKVTELVEALRRIRRTAEAS